MKIVISAILMILSLATTGTSQTIAQRMDEVVAWSTSYIDKGRIILDGAPLASTNITPRSVEYDIAAKQFRVTHLITSTIKKTPAKHDSRMIQGYEILITFDVQGQFMGCGQGYPSTMKGRHTIEFLDAKKPASDNQ